MFCLNSNEGMNSMKKKIIIIILTLILLGVLYFANQHYFLRRVSNVEVDAQAYGLNQDQMINTECYNVRNYLLYQSGLYFANASESAKIDGYPYWIVCSNYDMDYFSHSDKDTLIHNLTWNGKEVSVKFYNITKGYSTHINVVFELKQKVYIQGFLRDVYQNDKDQTLEEIDETYLKPLDHTIIKILDQYIEKE